MRISDWSSDVCSSDLDPAAARIGLVGADNAISPRFTVVVSEFDPDTEVDLAVTGRFRLDDFHVLEPSRQILESCVDLTQILLAVLILGVLAATALPRPGRPRTHAILAADQPQLPELPLQDRMHVRGAVRRRVFGGQSGKDAC